MSDSSMQMTRRILGRVEVQPDDVGRLGRKSEIGADAPPFAQELRDLGLGGQFRLAGLQPSHGQIAELLDWYTRSLESLGVEVRLGVEAGSAEVADAGADEVVVATGSRPPRTSFQRALPMVNGLTARGVAFHQIGDCVAPRRASLAFLEGRRLALRPFASESGRPYHVRGTMSLHGAPESEETR